MPGGPQARSQALEPLVRRYYPAMHSTQSLEYRKMLELSTKMLILGRACTSSQWCDGRAHRL